MTNQPGAQAIPGKLEGSTEEEEERYEIYGGPIYTCWDCGALVGEDGIGEHDSFHEWLKEAFGY